MKINVTCDIKIQNIDHFIFMKVTSLKLLNMFLMNSLCLEMLGLIDIIK